MPLNGQRRRLAINDSMPMNPASTMKLVTTLAGLELLGPQYVWRTEALATAPVVNGMLEGDLYPARRRRSAAGDRTLLAAGATTARRRLREIRGDLVLDRGAFEAIPHDPAAFDGEALRPYNAGPDALLLNYKSVSFHFVPDADAQAVRVYRDAAARRA